MTESLLQVQTPWKAEFMPHRMLLCFLCVHCHKAAMLASTKVVEVMMVVSWLYHRGTRLVLVTVKHKPVQFGAVLVLYIDMSSAQVLHEVLRDTLRHHNASERSS